jgi:tetratricopeptide (TPR) repeat protein
VAAGLLASAAGNTGDVGELVRVGEELRKHMPAEIDVAAHLFALSSVADRLMVLGRYELAELLVGKILSIREHPAASEPGVAGWIHRIRGFYALYLGDPATFAAEMSAAAEQFEAAGDLRNACMQRGHAGYGYLHGGDYDRAHRVLREALRTAERLGLDNVVTSVRVDLGLVLVRMGSIVRASEVLSRAANKCRRQRIPRLEGPARAYLATALARGGDLTGAEKEAREAAELTAAHPTARAIALATLARVLLQAGRVNDGLREANKAVAQLQAVGALTEGESLVRLTYAEALLAAGQRKAAKEAIEAARRRLLERAVSISDDAFRAHFLRSEPSNVRTLELAWELGKRTE